MTCQPPVEGRRLLFQADENGLFGIEPILVPASLRNPVHSFSGIRRFHGCGFQAETLR